SSAGATNSTEAVLDAGADAVPIEAGASGSTADGASKVGASAPARVDRRRVAGRRAESPLSDGGGPVSVPSDDPDGGDGSWADPAGWRSAPDGRVAPRRQVAGAAALARSVAPDIGSAGESPAGAALVCVVVSVDAARRRARVGRVVGPAAGASSVRSEEGPTSALATMVLRRRGARAGADEASDAGTADAAAGPAGSAEPAASVESLEASGADSGSLAALLRGRRVRGALATGAGGVPALVGAFAGPPVADEPLADDWVVDESVVDVVSVSSMCSGSLLRASGRGVSRGRTEGRRSVSDAVWRDRRPA
ncbi:MAG: hypothetical protein M3140_07185, partial [Actinomycetota bacterium]|nr:hypothetical protein [Actinomycetota bacterium]